ncbi:MAG: hypothetical protein QNI88_19555 [Desulfobacterales bacterium]|nr:hypothetical protein [Desulfobacterales bacterium]
MPIKRPTLCMLALTALTFFFLVDVSEAFARGPGGGGRGGGRGGGIGRGGPGGARGRAGFGRPGGRMHHRRTGPASRGNFHSRPKHRSGTRRPPRSSSYRRPESQRRPSRPTQRPPTRPSQPLPPPEIPSEEQLEKRAEIRDKQARRREERREDHWDHWHHRRHREELGTTYSSDYWDDDYCEAEVVVDGVTYFECDGVWYRQAYSGGSVNYVVVEGPRSE